MWGSFEHAGRLVDGLRPELQVLILQLLGSPVQGFGDQPALWHVTHALATQEIGNNLFIDVVQQASRALVIISCIDEELPSGVVINERTNQSPEDREDPGGSEDEEAAQRLRVVGLHHLNDAQQGLDARSPQMAHVQSFKVHQAGP